MSIREQIKELEIQREENKAELFELYAEQADQKLRWTLHQESTPFEHRLELEADIRDLEAERQHSKVKLMKLKQQLRLKSEQTYRQIVEQVIKDVFGEEHSNHVIDTIKLRLEARTQGEQ